MCVWSTIQLFSLSLVVSTLYYGGHLVINNLMSGGDLVAFVLYQIELGFALEVCSLLTYVMVLSYILRYRYWRGLLILAWVVVSLK